MLFVPGLEDAGKRGKCQAMTENNSQPLRKTRRSLPIALLRARETVMAPLREMLVDSGVNEQKWRVLRVLQENGPLELSQVAQEACLILSSLTRMARTMDADGLIARSTPNEDRRKTVIRITEQGERLVCAHSAASAGIFARIEEEFGPERLDALLDLLEDLQKLDLHRSDQTGPDQTGPD